MNDSHPGGPVHGSGQVGHDDRDEEAGHSGAHRRAVHRRVEPSTSVKERHHPRRSSRRSSGHPRRISQQTCFYLVHRRNPARSPGCTCCETNLREFQMSSCFGTGAVYIRVAEQRHRARRQEPAHGKIAPVHQWRIRAPIDPAHASQHGSTKWGKTSAETRTTAGSACGFSRASRPTSSVLVGRVNLLHEMRHQAPARRTPTPSLMGGPGAEAASTGRCLARASPMRRPDLSGVLQCLGIIHAGRMAP
jgi:hypothetical protein